MEAFLVSSLLCYNQWLKFFFLVLKKKRKINYNEVRKKVVDREGGENESGYVQRN